MPSASSAGSALSAAFAGVSPFATRRGRERDCEIPSPPAGSDSCFGVRSLDGSMSWSRSEHEPPEQFASSGSSGSSEQTSDDDDINECDQDRGGKPAAPSAAASAHVTSNDDTADSSSVGHRIADAMGSGIHPGSSVHAARAPPPSPSPSPFFDSRHTIITESRASSASSTTTIASLAAQQPDTSSANPAPSPASPASAPHRRGEDGAPPSPFIPPSPPTRRRDLAAIIPPPITHHALFDMLADAPSSEPSSPASLASLPSCVASMSSLSRMSSPADWDWRHPLSRSVATVDSHSDRDLGDEGDQHTGSAELVLPKLSLPSTSLHLGLERWDTNGQGTRIALVASPERTRDILGVLSARRPCVQLPHGEVGVLWPLSASAPDASTHPPLIQATIVTCLTVDHIRQRAHDSYTALHELLHPSPTPEQRAGLDAMVAAYSSGKDWIHLAVLLDEAAEDDTLMDTVPCTTLEEEAMRLAAEAEMHSSDDISPTSSLSLDSPMSVPNRTPRSLSSESLSNLRVQDTPRPVLETLAPWPSCEVESSSRHDGSEYHEDHATHASLYASQDLTPSDDPMDPVWGTVGLLERILDDPTRVHAASTAMFFEWRPTQLPDVASPMTGHTTSPASSTFEGPMPTVARAQGGGEWEATLSRRLAHRRELDAAASTRGPRQRGRGRGARRRRSHSPPSKPPCPNPLFPRRPAASSVGLVDLLDAAFAPVRRLVRTPWGQVMVACAIAVAVGCGIWAVRAHA